MVSSVHQLCKQRKLTLEQLADQSGLDLPTVQAIYLGRWTPSPEQRRAIAGVLGVAVDQIAWGHQTPIQHLYGHGPG